MLDVEMETQLKMYREDNKINGIVVVRWFSSV